MVLKNKTRPLDYAVILSYFVRDYEISLHDLRGLNTEQIKDLMMRFSYRMATIMLHGNTKKYFGGKLLVARENTCFKCCLRLREDNEFYEMEYPLYLSLEYVCQKCWQKGKVQGEMDKLFGIRV